MKRVLIICLSLLTVLALSACGGKTAKGKKSGAAVKKAEKVYEAGQSTDALLDYAKRLEAAGNHEAAEAVYMLIDKTATADGIYKGKTDAYEASLLDDADELHSIVKKAGGK